MEVLSDQRGAAAGDAYDQFVATHVDIGPRHRYYRRTVSALEHARDAIGADVMFRVVRTDEIDQSYLRSTPDGYMIGPGTPYSAPAAAESVIRAARERGVPLVGT